VLDALAARGVQFTQAWTTAPMTLPAHASMLTGLYPSQHGVHQNSRSLSDDHALLAERLRDAGYATAAFVSGYPLKREFGLARGFQHYDDELGTGNGERIAGRTTDRALEYLRSNTGRRVFVWVHYYDPHEPYASPEPFRSQYADAPYLGEIAYMDRELGRLIAGFEADCKGQDTRIVAVGDHGEGLGDHGEDLHGNLLYQGVMRVPLILAGSGIPTMKVDTAVSTRRVCDTILSWANLGSSFDLLAAQQEIVMAEAMKPYLQYGWQPQVMAVRNFLKVIKSGDIEVYDLRSDPSESTNLAEGGVIDQDLLEAIHAYGVAPERETGSPSGALDEESRRQLAKLGYVEWEDQAAVRKGAPSPRDMTHLFGDLDTGSALFVMEQYEASIAVFERVLAQDPENFMVTVRLAVSQSILRNEEQALRLFARAAEINPNSVDLQHYRAMHYFRSHRWEIAAPLFEQVLDAMPRRLPALEALAQIRASEGRFGDAVLLLKRAIALKESPSGEWLMLGNLEMAMNDTPAAIGAFEHAQSIQGGAFSHSLELGVCYLDAGRLAEAAAALDQVPEDHPGYAMALFKRAQVGVLRGEPDWPTRVRQAYDRADPEIRRLIRSESLFRGVPTP
jgi:tetratricopeptide (TPR) repeat protein